MGDSEWCQIWGISVVISIIVDAVPKNGYVSVRRRVPVDEVSTWGVHGAHATSSVFEGAGINDNVVFLGVKSDADGGLVMELRNGAVELVMVPLDETIMAQLLRGAVVDPDICAGCAVEFANKT